MSNANVNVNDLGASAVDCIRILASGARSIDVTTPEGKSLLREVCAWRNSLASELYDLTASVEEVNSKINKAKESKISDGLNGRIKSDKHIITCNQISLNKGIKEINGNGENNE